MMPNNGIINFFFILATALRAPFTREILSWEISARAWDGLEAAHDSLRGSFS